MTYDWNKQVEITVPTGTNGWIYSGEVIINGVKVRFPVGVPTTVPEPAAALLNKMIELEREEENNTAKPDNHYVGSVTIPEGKTLTLAKGAKVVDEDGVLGGSSTPAPVVILPETELTYDETEGGFLLLTPWMVDLVAGGVYDVTYNGVKYECEGVPYTESGLPVDPIALGNVELMGLTGGNTDAPFAVMCFPNEGGAAMGAYAMFSNTDGATSVTLSIVQTGEASADSGNGTSDFIVTGMLNTTTFSVSNVSKTYDEVHAAAEERKNIKLYLDVQGQGSYVVMPLTQMTQTVLAFGSIIPEGARWIAQYTADGMTVKVG